MWSARQVGIVVAYAAIPLLLVVGSVALAVTEGATAPTATTAAPGSPAPASSPVTPTETLQPTSTAAPTSTIPPATATAAVTGTASPTPSPTRTPATASATAAAQPTATSRAARPATATEGTLSPRVFPQAGSCGPFPGWSKTYVVRPGDTLFLIALRHRTSVWELRQANCKSSTAVSAGERLWVPAAKSSHWQHRSVPAFRWEWWKQLRRAGIPWFAPDP